MLKIGRFSFNQNLQAIICLVSIELKFTNGAGMKNKNLTVATLITSISGAVITPVAFADDAPDMLTMPYGHNEFYGEDCSMCCMPECMSATYCMPGCEGGPSFQDCASCYGREGPQGTTCAADTDM